MIIRGQEGLERFELRQHSAVMSSLRTGEELHVNPP
jgi:hypothetical protein